MPLILDITLKGSALLVLAALAVFVGRRAAAAERHFVWNLALAGLLVLPLLSFALPWRLPLLPAPAAPVASPRPSRETPAAAPTLARVPTPLPDASSAVVSEGSRTPTIGADSAPAAPARRWTLRGTLTALWAAGLALALGRLAIGVLALRWLARGSREVTDPAWQADLDAAAERLDLAHPVRLLESPHANMPMAFGLRRPAVILPMDRDGWTAEVRESVLLHELAHIRRRDVFSNLVGQAACVMYWFHPLVWAAASRLRHEAERACDDLVLRAGAQPSQYAEQLLTMVQRMPRFGAPALAVPLAQRSAFEGRVLAILEPGVSRGGLTRRAATLGAVSLLAIAVPLAALAPRAGAAAQNPEPRPAPAASPAVSVTPDVRPESAALAEPGLLAEARTEAPAELAAEVKPPQQEPALPGGAQATLGLLDALQDEHVAVRAAAAQALGERGDTAAINALLAALRRDTSREVRRVAAWALGEIEDSRAVPGLVAALREERDREVRHAIVQALGEIESPDAVPGLSAAVRGEDDVEIRRLMVWALGEIESAEAVPVLMTLIRDPDQETRRQVARALGEIESPAAVEPLAAMLQAERDAGVRETIVWALGEIEDPRASVPLQAALRDTSLAVRRKAVWALGELDGLEQAPAGLIAATRDSDVEVRRGAAHALSEIQDPASVPALVAMLRDTDLDVRRNAVHALGEIRGTQAVEALVAALRDEDPEIRRLAAQALGNR